MAQTTGPVGNYIGPMIKDVGIGCAYWAHKLASRREPAPIVRHQNIRLYKGMCPYHSAAAFIAPSAMVQGNVILGHNTSIMYHSTVRNFHTKVPTTIGDNSTILERVSFSGQIGVGHNSIIGIGTSLDSCSIGDGVYIGHCATICLGASIENGAIVAAGSVVGQDVRVGAGELWAGVPAVKVADVTDAQANEVAILVKEACVGGKKHKKAVEDTYARNKEFTKEWFDHSMQMIEKQQTDISVPLPAGEIPIEAKPFLTPRVMTRVQATHSRSNYPVDRLAPWKVRGADTASNA